MQQPFNNLENAFWSIDTKTTSQIIGCYLQLESQPDAEKLRSELLELSHLLPRMRQRVSEDSALSWSMAKDFDLEQHFHLIEEAGVSTPTELNQLVAAHFSKPIEPTKPQWEIFLFSNRPFKERSGPALAAFIFKFHHSFADGISGLEIVRSLTSKLPDSKAKYSRPFICLLYTSPSPRDATLSRMPSSA